MINKLKPKSEFYRNILIFSTATTQIFGDNLFVSIKGNDLNDCKSEKTSCKTIQKSVNLAKAGDTVYIKAGNYGNEKVTFPNSGTADRLITLEGYKNKPGDKPMYLNPTPNMVLDPLLMPLLDGNDLLKSTAFGLYGKEYIQIRHFQIKNYNKGIYSTGGSRKKPLDGIHFSYIYAREFGSTSGTFTPKSGGATTSANWGYGIALSKSHKYSSIEHCVVINAGGDSILAYGDHNKIRDNKVFATWYDEKGLKRINNTDYDITIRGDNNVVDNNYIKTDITLYHRGHGISILTDENGNWTPCVAVEYDTAQYNVVTNNTVEGAGTGLQLRHDVANNFFTNNSIINTICGIGFTDGAHDNNIAKTIIRGATYMVSFVETPENGKDILFPSISDNMIDTIIAEDIHHMIDLSIFAPSEKYYLNIQNNIIKNLTIKNAKKLYETNKHKYKKNIIKNNQILNVKLINVSDSSLLLGFNIVNFVQTDRANR